MTTWMWTARVGRRSWRSSGRQPPASPTSASPSPARWAVRWSTPTPCSSTAAWTSAPPSCRAGERRGVPHHLLDVLDVTAEASVADYQRDVRAPPRRRPRPRSPAGAGRAARGSTCGRPSTSSSSRRPTRRYGPRWSRRPTARSAPPARTAAASSTRRRPAAILPGNVRRVVRALEVIELTGRPFSASLPEPRYAVPAVQIGLGCRRDGARRAHRPRGSSAMWDGGLLDEVARLAAAGCARVAPRPAPSATRQALAAPRRAARRGDGPRGHGPAHPPARPAAGVLVRPRPAGALARRPGRPRPGARPLERCAAAVPPRHGG